MKELVMQLKILLFHVAIYIAFISDVSRKDQSDILLEKGFFQLRLQLVFVTLITTI